MGAIRTGSPSPTSVSSIASGEVCFRYRDYAHGNKVKVMRLPAEEWICAFPGASPSGARHAPFCSRQNGYPTVSAARPPQGLPAHPPLRAPRQPPPHRTARRLPGRARCPDSRTARSRNRRSVPPPNPRDRSQQLPLLWSRTAPSTLPLPARASGHRTTAPAMGRLNHAPRHFGDLECSRRKPLYVRPPIDPAPPQNHTFKPAQLPEPHGEAEP